MSGHVSVCCDSQTSTCSRLHNLSYVFGMVSHQSLVLVGLFIDAKACSVLRYPYTNGVAWQWSAQ
jgi:hypothetical protein